MKTRITVVAVALAALMSLPAAPAEAVGCRAKHTKPGRVYPAVCLIWQQPLTARFINVAN